MALGPQHQRAGIAEALDLEGVVLDPECAGVCWNDLACARIGHSLGTTPGVHSITRILPISNSCLPTLSHGGLTWPPAAQVVGDEPVLRRQDLGHAEPADV